MNVSARRSCLLLTQNGMSLVELLVSVGIMAIIMAGFASMQVQQQRESRAITEKLASMDFEKLLQSAMMDGTTCKFILNNPTALTFNSTALSPTTPQYVTPSRPLYAQVNGATPGPVVAQLNQPLSGNPSLVPNLIRLKIESGSGGTYIGRWEVHFDSDRLVRALKPVTVSTVLTVDTSNPSAARIMNCLGEHVPQFANVSYHPFCATPSGGLLLKPLQANRICTLTATDDDVGSTAVAAGDYKCRVQADATSWRGYAPMGCGQVACVAVCFDLQ